ncbi:MULTISPECIES: YdgA family protein [unclassified Brenneria]|uniref:YdgA family protein n=1 Tax=unclassified Brenneria TaxID=2634434 RepID=UPI0029C2F243|nr:MULTISPECIES: YdgA family protein [unclassified Brenneria]MDX5626869.1 YdgA family protein [Brenneria sp. L3-3Z]MDX5693781.1 YdgA family protein [Brenneria sp. L4-2C]MEE3661573.1 YdgA family protein [Brenneria sp. g21c3]
MKKSLVAAGVIIALGAVWTGASWYTGKQLAQNIDEFTDNINAQIKSAYPDAAIKAVYRDYQGGIFSSKVTFVMQYDGSDKWQKPLAPGEEIVINNTVYHGPFPLSQLKKFNLIPAMAAVHAELGDTPVINPLFELTQGKPFFTSESRVAYSGAIGSDIRLLPIEFQENDQKFSFSGAQLLLDTTSDFRGNKLSGAINNLLIEKKNPWDELESFTLKDLALNVNNHKGKFDIGIGDGKVTAKSLTVAVEGREPVALNNISIQSTVTEDDKNLAGNTTIGLESLTFGDRNLGSGNLSIHFSQFDGEGTRQFATDYQKTLQPFLQSAAKEDPQAYQHQVMIAFLQNLPKLLKGNPSVAISPLSWKNSKGESTFTLTLDMTDPLQNSAAAADPQASDEEKIILQSVKKLDAKLNVPLEMLAELMVQAEKPSVNADEQEQAREMALQQANMMASIGQMNSVTVTKDNAITSSLQYADGQIDFNGHKISLSDFIAPFIGLPAEDDN